MNREFMQAIAKIKTDEVENLIDRIIFPSKDRKEVIDAKRLLIRTDEWMKNTLGMDDFAKNINRLVYVLDQTDKEYSNREYIEYLQEELCMDIEDIQSDYTYNNPDACRLDIDVLYTTFTHDYQRYALLSLHYGLDARVGFGPNICFLVDEDYFLSSMSIDATDSKTHEEYPVWEVGRIATFDEEKQKWVHNESGGEIILTSDANGW